MKRTQLAVVAVGLLLVVLVVLAVMASRVVPTADLQYGSQRPGKPVPEEPIEEPTPVPEESSLTMSSCSGAGGTWNECGSACRTEPEAICILMCVQYCECASDAQCPDGYACGDYVDGTGVCKAS